MTSPIRFQGARSSSRLLHVVDLLFEKPVLTISQVQADLGLNFQAANRYVGQLEEAGVLREITGHARNRIYRAEVMQAIEGPVEVG